LLDGGDIVRAILLAGVGVLAVYAIVPAVAAELSAASNLKPDASLGAKWDRCEALARQRGTPPGKIGYGDFITDCVKKDLSDRTRTAGRQ
jgi:hypothetical protein